MNNKIEITQKGGSKKGGGYQSLFQAIGGGGKGRVLPQL